MVAVRDAATVMLLADRPDLHVFVLRRAHTAVFGPGATVFPGGAVDDADRDPALRARVRGLTPAATDRLLGRAGAPAWWLAAVRECFEEAGILLARSAATGETVTADDGPAAPRFERWRDRLNAGAVSFAEFLAAEDLMIDARDLHVFSHWRTPIGPPRRYDTWFFVAAAPSGQEGVHDDNELVESAWVRPAEALAAYSAGHLDLVFPTFATLQMLAGFRHAADALHAVGTAARHDDGRPFVVREHPSERIALTGEAYDAVGWAESLPDVSWREEAEYHGAYVRPGDAGPVGHLGEGVA